MNEQITFFESNYSVISDINTFADEHKIFIGDKKVRNCGNDKTH